MRSCGLLEAHKSTWIDLKSIDLNGKSQNQDGFKAQNSLNQLRLSMHKTTSDILQGDMHL